VNSHLDPLLLAKGEKKKKTRDGFDAVSSKPDLRAAIRVEKKKKREDGT